MRREPNSKKDRRRLSGFLFAHFGDSVGIDIVPFLTDDKKVLKGREDFYKTKKK